jgi:hypothetical protein
MKEIDLVTAGACDSFQSRIGMGVDMVSLLPDATILRHMNHHHALMCMEEKACIVPHCQCSYFAHLSLHQSDRSINYFVHVIEMIENVVVMRHT